MRGSLLLIFRIVTVLTITVFFTGNSLWSQQPAQSSAGKTRTEKDLLGEKQIPADAYYGVRTQRAMENF